LAIDRTLQRVEFGVRRRWRELDLFRW